MILWGKHNQKSYEDMDPADYNNTCLERCVHLYNCNINVIAVANHFWSAFEIEFILSTITCAKSSKDM